MTTKPIVPLKFGISELDSLVEPLSSAGHGEMGSDPWQATIVGPDGSGKSILALHLASRFAAGASSGIGKVIYVSTDLSSSQAQKTWSDFCLQTPMLRETLLHKHYPFNSPSGPAALRSTLTLKPVQPENESHLEELLAEQSKQPTVYFVDLQKSTTGDDWSFLNKLVGLLPKPPKLADKAEKHLLIIDAIEGLETVVGDRDSYGQRRSRRSRIAQLIRTCMSRQCVHLAMVIEEPRPGVKLPEQFVADMVLRVRQIRENDYLLRTIEVEKCRGVPHVRGQHEFHIRTGRGTKTGSEVNLDDPVVSFACNEEGVDDVSSPRFMSHIKVIPTLHHWNRLVREDDAELRPTRGEPTFGVDQLDRFFVRDESRLHETESLADEEERSFPPASLTLLLGDAGTYKSRLARSFLAQGFRLDESVSRFSRSILISSGWDDRVHLVKKLTQHISSTAEECLSRTYCRRISIRHVTGAHFLEIVESTIHHAQLDLLFDIAAAGMDPNLSVDGDTIRILHATDGVSPEERTKETMKLRQRVLDAYFTPHLSGGDKQRQRWHVSSIIRLAFDDWSLLLASHPSLSADPLVLQSLLALLRREGVSALIVSTQSGQPLVPTMQLDPQDLRKLDLGQIYTWNVPFFGQKRTAITVLSSGGVRHPEVFELRSEGVDRERIHVDPHFALYAGLEEGTPRRIPLVVRLYMGDHASDSGAINAPAFPRIMRHALTQIFPSTPDSDVVRFEGFLEYDDFFTFTDWLDDSRVDHTLIFQIDEFWSSGKPSLLDLSDYWDTIVSRREVKGGKLKTCENGDPYEVFFPGNRVEEAPPIHPVPEISSLYSDAERDALRKSEFFIKTKDGGPRRSPSVSVDRVPFIWDFGIILGRRDLWARCVDLEIEGVEFPRNGALNKETKMTVGEIWNGLCLEKDAFGDWDKQSNPITWAQFLSACRLVSNHTQSGIFSVDLRTAESLSSLLLELWGSIDRQMSDDGVSPFEALADRTADLTSLRRLLRERPLSLFLACCQLFSSCGHLQARYRQMDLESSAGAFAARREWYSTSASIMRREELHSYCALSLPGTFATRGDWSLAVAKGSRSELLAHRALDLLCSRQMNIVRLHDGLGLPTRDVAPEKHAGRLQSALTRIIPDTKEREYLWYEDVCRLGENPAKLHDMRNAKQGFTWLWRSQLRSYQRDSFFLRRWISRLFEERSQWFDPTYGTRKGWSNMMLFFQESWNRGMSPDGTWSQALYAESIVKMNLEIGAGVERLPVGEKDYSGRDLEVLRVFLSHFSDFFQKMNLLAAVLDDE